MMIREKSKQTKTVKLKASSINCTESYFFQDTAGSSTQNGTRITGRTMCLKS